MILLVCGSSARRGATGWTDAAKIRDLIDTLRPDATVDGASPAGGADAIAHVAARAHFAARGLAPENARRCPVDTSLDGPWPAAGHRRNARMDATHRPSIGAAFISGAVGSPLSSGSAGMVRILRARAVPVVVVREDGVEPDPSPLATLRALYRLAPEPAMVPAGQAVRAFLGGNAGREEVLAALGFAREGSRLGAWLEAVAAAVNRG